MELWNTRNLLAPPTYTYEANADEIDINHLKSILQDGISFYNDQNLLNVEVALLSRIVYRMKTKFRNSKDFQTFEKVKKDLNIFEGMNISTKLEYLLSMLPSVDYHDVMVSLPTKNMIDFILVQLQGVGKILCRAIQTCKHTVIIYEHRLYLGHFWKMALIAIALVSRIHILCLNLVKFTCLLYLRLLPFSHKLKNVTTNWLPKEYVFPKDLKSWLNVEWCKLEEVIEIPDNEFNLSFINLVDDSDDEVECIEVLDDTEILEDFRKIRRSQLKILDFESNNAFTSKYLVDIGEEIAVDEDDIQNKKHNNNKTQEETNETLKNDQEVPEEHVHEEVDLGEEISSSEEDPQPNTDQVDMGEVISSSDDVTLMHKHQKATEVDLGEVILSDDEIFEVPRTINLKKTKFDKHKSCELVISSSDNEDDNTSVQFVAETKLRKPCVTSDFIPLESSTPSQFKTARPLKFRAKKRPKKGNNSKKETVGNASVVIIPDSPNNSVKTKKTKNVKTESTLLTPKNRKRKSDENSRKNVPNKKKKK